MTEQAVAHCEKRWGLRSLPGALSCSLPVLAMVVACCISLLGERAVPIEKPAVLVFGAVLILIPFRSKIPNTLQRIVGLYMVGVLVNESSARSFQILFLLPGISISWSTIILLLCAIGYLCGRMSSVEAVRRVDRTGLSYGWMIVLAVIIVHMILLSAMLNRFYGYGYERNLTVLGNLCLYFLLFMTLWDKLSRVAFRQSMGFVFVAYYLAVTILRGF